MAQLPGHLVDDGIGRPAQPGEKVAEPGVAVPEVVQLPLHILLDVPAHQGVERLVLHRGKASLLQHIPGNMLQKVVQEGADLGRVKGRRFPGPGPQAVLHEIGKVAAAQPLQPGGRHGDLLPVQSPHRRPGQRAPLQRPCPVHGAQSNGILPIRRQALPEFSARSLTRHLQGRLNCC